MEKILFLSLCLFLRRNSTTDSKMDLKMSRIMRKLMFWFPTRSDTKQAVQLQKMARGLKFRI